MIRVPVGTVERAEALTEQLSARPEYAGMRMAWTTVLRLALLRGLDALEAKLKQKRGK